MEPIDYKIIRRARRKTASIIVKPDKTIQVVVPAFLKDGEIAQLVDKKRKWISKKIAEIENNQLNITPHKYEEGELFPYLGNNFSLLTPISNRAEITFTADTITVPLPPKLPPKARRNFIQTTLHLFYIRTAREILTEKTGHLGQLCGLRPTSVGTKDYKSRWGCCFRDGRIYYNWRIIAAPEPIIDYVIFHELCHLAEPNHSKKYWEIVAGILPDWQERRAWLKQHGFALDI
jgi:predicted metal-dependent hydrolase